jgi:hypothetical protein
MNRLIGAAIALGVSGIASATSMSLTFDGFGAGVQCRISYQSNQNYAAANRSGSTGTNIQAKEHTFTDVATSRTYRNYCVQIFESVSPGNTYTYNQVSINDVPDFPPGPGPMGALRGSLMKNLYARFYNDVADGTDNIKCAAFALLVWEISHENLNGAGATATDVLNAGAIDVGLGAFQVTTAASLTGDRLAVYQQAMAWSAIMKAQSANLRSRGIYGLTNPTAQDHIGVVVPVPAPALLAGLGLVGVVSGRRRSR